MVFCFLNCSIMQPFFYYNVFVSWIPYQDSVSLSLAPSPTAIVFAFGYILDLLIRRNNSSQSKILTNCLQLMCTQSSHSHIYVITGWNFRHFFKLYRCIYQGLMLLANQAFAISLSLPLSLYLCRHVTVSSYTSLSYHTPSHRWFITPQWWLFLYSHSFETHALTHARMHTLPSLSQHGKYPAFLAARSAVLCLFIGGPMHRHTPPQHNDDRLFIQAKKERWISAQHSFKCRVTLAALH